MFRLRKDYSEMKPTDSFAGTGYSGALTAMAHAVALPLELGGIQRFRELA